MIKQIGKGGIKALLLSAPLEKEGITPPSKPDLLKAGVRSADIGDGTSYAAGLDSRDREGMSFGLLVRLATCQSGRLRPHLFMLQCVLEG